MKFAIITILALLLTAQIAEAKPKAKIKAEAEAEAAFSCQITELKIVDAPDPRGLRVYNALVRVNCQNTKSQQGRIKSGDVFLEDEAYETDPTASIDALETFNAYYADSPGTAFMTHHVDIAPHKSADFVVYFEDVRSGCGIGLVLDINGTKYPLPVLPH